MARAETKWTQNDAGQRYEHRRFRSSKARRRDPLLVTRLLERFGRDLRRVLDVPSGTGRLSLDLRSTGADYVAADLSLAMLGEVTGDARLQTRVHALPFADDSFDAVVCCRLLHHLGPEERLAAIAELARVSRGLVVASFWDAGSWHAWRRRAGLRRATHEDTRLSATRSAIRADFEAAGARVLGHAASFRFVSPQTFVAAEVHGR